MCNTPIAGIRLFFHLRRFRMNTRRAFCRSVVAFAIGLAWAAQLFASVPQGLTILRSTPQELILRYTPTVSGWDSFSTQNGASVRLPRIAGSRILNSTDGTPSWLGISLPITVPAPGAFSIESVVTKGVHQQDVLLLPASVKPSTDNSSSAPVLSPVYYSAPTPEWATVQYSGIARDRHIANLVLTAARFNTNERRTEIPKEIILTIRFTPSTAIAKEKSKLATEDDLVTTINAKESSAWRITTPDGKNNDKKGNQTQSNSDISSGTWLKIKVSQEGIYSIDAAQLQQVGVSIAANEVSTIKIFGSGGMELSELPSSINNQNIPEQPIEVKVKGDGSLDAIIFYGAAASGFKYNPQNKLVEHYLNRYSNDNYYLLTWGGRNGLRMQNAPQATGDVQNRPQQYTARIFNEEELENPYGAGSGRRWFGKIIDSFSPRIYTTLLPNLSRTGKIQYRALVAHKVSEPAVDSIFEGNNLLAVLNLSAKNDGLYEEFQSNQTLASVDASAIPSDNRSTLKFTYRANSGSSGANGYVDFFEIHYPAEMAAINNELEFSSNPGMSGITEYAFNQFSGDLRGYDVTNRTNPLKLQNTASTGGMFIFRTQLDSTAPKRFFISGSYRTPELQKISLANLRDDMANADLILIVPQEFRSTADAYKQYRDSQGELSVKVVNVEDIYNEFGGGLPDISSIRNYIGYAYSNWQRKPRYVLLWGDGHFDYKAITTRRPNFIPTWQSDDSERTFNISRGWSYIDSYSTEDYFVRVVGDDYISDLGIGRMTVDSKESSDWMLEKIKMYETESVDDQWRTMMMFLADDGPTSSGATDRDTHTNQSEEIARDTRYTPEDMQEKKIYMVEYPVENIPKGRRKPRATEDMISFINNRGAVVLNWIGHGNPRVWAHETLFDREITTPQFVNKKRLFFLIAATCDFARFDMTETQSGAEAMVMSRNGAAIASFSSTRVVYSAQNSALAKELYNQLFTRGSDGRYRRLGDVVMSTKQGFSTINDQKYFLLGDPALRLHIPDYQVRIDSINGMATSGSELADVKALSTMNVVGRITRYGSDQTENSFNGSAIITMYDSDLQLNVADPAAIASLNDTTTHHFVKLGGALHRGSYQVENGRFTAQFVVPKDIAFLNKFGRMFVYAQSADKRYAKGETSKFTVGGLENVSLDDTQGPDMQIFMDGRTFKANDIVRSNPLLIVDLFDKTGINTTGIGIGHKIEAWFDDNITPVDLTDDFTTSLKDSRSGSAIKQVFGLAPGRHTVRVRAWDILNNYTEASTYFRVGEKDNTVISGRVEVYPNPFSDKTNILFTHNQGLSFTTQLKLFTIHGQQVRSFMQSVPELQSGIFEWDGRDEEGSTLPQGVYPFVLYFTAPDGTVETESGRVVLLRN